MIVTLEEAKTHLRVQHDEEDALTTGLIEQAQTAAEDFCRVSFEPYVDDDGCEADVPGPVKLAVLLMVGYFYEHREAEDGAGFRTMRRAFMTLLYPYRDLDRMF